MYRGRSVPTAQSFPLFLYPMDSTMVYTYSHQSHSVRLLLSVRACCRFSPFITVQPLQVFGLSKGYSPPLVVYSARVNAL